MKMKAQRSVCYDSASSLILFEWWPCLLQYKHASATHLFSFTWCKHKIRCSPIFYHFKSKVTHRYFLYLPLARLNEEFSFPHVMALCAPKTSQSLSSCLGTTEGIFTACSASPHHYTSMKLSKEPLAAGGSRQHGNMPSSLLCHCSSYSAS